MDAKLNPVKNRFPNRSDLIASLYRNDSSFNSLCDDYYLVAEQIRELKGSEKASSSSDMVELKKLLSELEDEFNMYFGNA